MDLLEIAKELAVTDDSFVSVKDLVPLIKAIKNPQGIEIGLSSGASAFWLLSRIHDLTLTSVDPYVPYEDWNGTRLTEQTNFNDLTTARFRLAPYMNRFNHFHTTSDIAANFFRNNAYDFIFIDGLHTYDQVLADCRNYWPKIKNGGIFAGHDYRAIEDVKRAVDDFAAEINAGIHVSYFPQCDIWWWYK